MNLANLFNPSSILITGSSANPTKVGHLITKNIINSGYQGNLYQLNPKAKQILNHPVSQSFEDIHEAIIVNIISIPGEHVLEQLKQWGRHKEDLQYDDTPTFAVIISAGFGEQGNHDLEHEILETARKYNIHVVGPNCLGVIAHHGGPLGYNGSFTYAPKNTNGNIAFISQSGALISSIVDTIEAKSVGFRSIISLGNQSDLSMNDFLTYYISDDETKVIGVYVEGLKDGERLQTIIQGSSKPIIILKAGKSSASQEAATSHTGSIAGDFGIAQMYIQNSGAIFTNSYQEFVTTLYTMSIQME